MLLEHGATDACRLASIAALLQRTAGGTLFPAELPNMTLQYICAASSHKVPPAQMQGSKHTPASTLHHLMLHILNAGFGVTACSGSATAMAASPGLGGLKGHQHMCTPTACGLRGHTAWLDERQEHEKACAEAYRAAFRFAHRLHSWLCCCEVCLKCFCTA